MNTDSHFKVEGMMFAPASRIGPRVFRTPEEVRIYLDEVLTSDFYLSIAHLRGNSDLGDFLLWTRGDDAYVRVDEHQDHIAYDGSLPKTGDEQVVFGDGFAVSSSYLVSRSKAMKALECWLNSGKRTEILSWT